MAQTPAQKRRDQAVLRRVLKRFREDPELGAVYQRWRDEARADIDKEKGDGRA
jgi:hypothetical protein